MALSDILLYGWCSIKSLCFCGWRQITLQPNNFYASVNLRVVYVCVCLPYMSLPYKAQSFCRWFAICQTPLLLSPCMQILSGLKRKSLIKEVCVYNYVLNYLQFSLLCCFLFSKVLKQLVMTIPSSNILGLHLGISGASLAALQIGRQIFKTAGRSHFFFPCPL